MASSHRRCSPSTSTPTSPRRSITTRCARPRASLRLALMACLASSVAATAQILSTITEAAVLPAPSETFISDIQLAPAHDASLSWLEHGTQQINEADENQRIEIRGDDGDKSKNDDKSKSHTSSKATKKHETKSHKLSSTSSAKAASTSSSSAFTTPTPTPSATQPTSNVPMPSPFDQSLPSDFKNGASDSNACPNFVKSVLQSTQLQTCYPVSMMLQTSSAFFDAEKSLNSIVRVLDTTCSANSGVCADFLSQAAHNMTSDANCGAELRANATQPLYAYNGMRAFDMLYKATCLQDPQADMYCFANAVTNETTASNTYLYFMPLGVPLPGVSKPSCGWCTKQTMGIYHDASADRSQLIADVYLGAANQINTICGINFVNATLPPAESTAAPFAAISSSWLLLLSTAGLAVLLSL